MTSNTYALLKTILVVKIIHKLLPADEAIK